MPSMELFAAQDDTYRRRVLPPGPVRVAVEAGVRAAGWDRWLLGQGGREAKAAFVGMAGFGASAPAERLYAAFGITAEAVAGAARERL
jgi:transketolase